MTLIALAFCAAVTARTLSLAAGDYPVTFGHTDPARGQACKAHALPRCHQHHARYHPVPYGVMGGVLRQEDKPR